MESTYNTPVEIIKESYTSKGSNGQEVVSGELVSSCEFLRKNERILLGFVGECPKPEEEIVEYLKSKQITESATVDLLNKAVQTRRVFRVEIDGVVFYRFNDFPDKVNFLLLCLDAATEKDSWVRLFIEKLKHNIITQFPKYDLKMIYQSTIVEISIRYQQFQNENQQLVNQLLKTLSEIDLKAFDKLEEIK